MSRFYLTTPIYYVNDLPHIGHIYTTLVCDAVARYRRLRGDDVRFLTGTDEHGQKIEQAAREAGLEPIQLADRVVARYHELWRRLGISHDDFVRTTEPRHYRGVAEIIRRFATSDDLYVARHEGWYCPACETFYTEKELLPGRLCPDHRRPVEWKSEDNVFFRLSRYQQRLLDWYDSKPAPLRPATRANEMRAFVAGGLRDISVSRTSLQWGIPFPGHPGHVVYVWLDALTNYISALGFGAQGAEAERYEKFWAGGDTRLHMVGKDIIRFHTVYWPAFLMSAGVPLPTTVYAHGWWLRDDRKMSKSVGNVARPDELLERLGAEPLRYFLLREMAFGQDANFSDEAVVERYNSDLANGLGNTLSRLVTLSRRAFGNRTPPLPPGDGRLAAVAREVAADYRAAMDDFAFHRALEALWRLLAETNQHLVTAEPWKLLKDESASGRVAEILGQGLEAVRVVAVGLLPVMPQTAAKVLRTLGGEPPASLQALAWGGLAAGAPLAEPEPRFPRLDKESYFATGAPIATGGAAVVSPSAGAAPASPAANPTQQPAKAPAKEPQRMAQITIDDFMGVELKVATVRAAEEVPKSSKLVKLTVDLGDEQRTVVAGIRKAYPPEQLVGRQVVIVANLQPATLMGVESQGMVLAASQEGEPVLLHPDREVPPGTRVR
ncbi:MAG TPA: methionine--tRNA ligase [Thermoanaerobaculia bacterium]|nr:methionine--tRNA ligase [Thermoanaerobaculia bacterium]